MAHPLFRLLFALLPCAAALGQTPTLRADTRLVVVDVVVTDSHGNPVHNLKQSDFALLENGKAQSVNHFDEHSALSPGTPLRYNTAPKMEPGSFTNFTPAPVDGPLNILLLDELNTPLKDQSYLHDEILKYLKSPHGGQRMAIFGLSTQLRLLQGFTSDPELLRSAVTGKRATPQGSTLLNNPTTGDGAGSSTVYDNSLEMLNNTGGPAVLAANVAQFQAMQQSFQLQLRARYTLDAMNQIARYLGRLSGRKNLIWFSGSFPVNILPDGDSKTPFDADASAEDEFRETVGLLSRGQVAVYPIDARGLMTSPDLDVSIPGSKSAISGQAATRNQTKFAAATADENGTMRAMADETGGKAFVNTNALSEAVDKAVEAGSNFYTLTYSPSDRKDDGSFHEIAVKLAKSGYSLSYRKGYYADEPEKPVGHKDAVAAAPAGAAPPYDPMRAAMLWGGPDPTQILFRASIAPSPTAPEDAVAKGNQAGPKAKGPYQRYTVVFAADPKDIAFGIDNKNNSNVRLEFVTFVYDLDGGLINSQGDKLSAALPPERMDGIRKGGVQYRHEISLPVNGQYVLRVGVHDLLTDHVGALELPVSAVRNLKAAAAAKAP